KLAISLTSGNMYKAGCLHYGSSSLQYDEKTKADPGCHLICPGFTDRLPASKICNCTELLKNTTC
ncbi:MAG: hypothetical protein JW894_03405, partial [Bacteroidales bacterium]|nr:hypothetical protein [Bacteroidales bacterium]